MYIDFIIRDRARDLQTKAIRVRFYVEDQLAHSNEYLPLVTQRFDQAILSEITRLFTSEELLSSLYLCNSYSVRPLLVLRLDVQHQRSRWLGRRIKCFKVMFADPMSINSGRWEEL